ncbi:MerR family transcriptional regulator [Nocardioides sp. SYSU DS0663]|uniref:MerR family transcriptional regulator n=1 Tax=Nocardioides sp. SYSU DS0663 TaxID=3416445 RepID=UPI003F4B72E8
MKSSERIQPFSIGDLAQRFGLGTHVLRHWEDVGLLSPARDASGRRRYSREDVVRVAVVVRSKAAGMSLEQVALMLDGEADGRRAVLEAYLEELERRMVDLERHREMAEHALRCTAHDIATCPRFRSRVDDLLEGKVEAFPTLEEIHAALG